MIHSKLINDATSEINARTYKWIYQLGINFKYLITLNFYVFDANFSFSVCYNIRLGIFTNHPFYFNSGLFFSGKLFI